MVLARDLGRGRSAPRRLVRLIARRKTRISAAFGGAAFLVLVLHASRYSVPNVLTAGLAVLLAAVLLPPYAAWLVIVEDAINRKLALVTPARLVRVILLAPIFGCAIGAAGFLEAIVPATWGELLARLGAMNGLYAIGVTLAYGGHGERIGNSVLAISVGIWLTCFSGWAVGLLVLVLNTVFVAHLTMGLLSDLRSRLFPRSGVGVFFGSFNPVHRMHLQLLKDFIEQRRLEKVYVHATTIPKLHRDALNSGEIEAILGAGVREYRKTPLADPAKNYFPTGAWFFEYELRLELLRAAIRDVGLDNRVEVLSLADIYERSGFFGILRHIKTRHRGQPVHGLHGSDAGGMWVRNIFDSSGWIYPFPVVRTGSVSATAIRGGAVGMTSETVERFLLARRCGKDFTFPSGYVFRNSHSREQCASEL